MFSLEEVVETTAFFRRTAAETFPPTGDGWWTQRYNTRALGGEEAELLVESPVSPQQPPLFHVDWLGPVTNPAGQAALQVAHGEPLRLAGWALDAAGRRPARAVDLVLDGYGIEPRSSSLAPMWLRLTAMKAMAAAGSTRACRRLPSLPVRTSSNFGSSAPTARQCRRWCCGSRPCSQRIAVAAGDRGTTCARPLLRGSRA